MGYYVIRTDTQQIVVPASDDYARVERAGLLINEELKVNCKLYREAYAMTSISPTDAETVREHYPSYWDADPEKVNEVYND